MGPAVCWCRHLSIEAGSYWHQRQGSVPGSIRSTQWRLAQRSTHHLLWTAPWQRVYSHCCRTTFGLQTLRATPVSLWSQGRHTGVPWPIMQTELRKDSSALPAQWLYLAGTAASWHSISQGAARSDSHGRETSRRSDIDSMERRQVLDLGCNSHWHCRWILHQHHSNWGRSGSWGRSQSQGAKIQPNHEQSHLHSLGVWNPWPNQHNGRSILERTWTPHLHLHRRPSWEFIPISATICHNTAIQSHRLWRQLYAYCRHRFLTASD